MLKVGLLTPRSTLFPALSTEWLTGLKLFLKHRGMSEKISLSIDNIGFGINEQEIYSKAEKLVLQEDYDVVVLFADNHAADMLKPLFTAVGKLLLVVNFGANFPDSWEASPFVLYHSLNFCFHAGLTGKLAASGHSKEAINVLSYYDGGYRQCFCMLNSHQSHGGIPVLNHITQLRLNEFTLNPVAEFLDNNAGTQNLICLFAGEQAERFYQEIIPICKKHQLCLFVSPMMFDETIKTGGENNEINVTGYIPWHSSLDNDANRIFKDVYHSATGKKVNYFSLLGWETGILLATIIEKQGGDPATLISSLTNENLNSPRGWLKLDARTHHTYGTVYLAKLIAGSAIVVQKESENMQKEWGLFTQIKLAPGESSSWRNTYLCI
jgi:branched-chain amino acid transport system substrate-binding protein